MKSYSGVGSRKTPQRIGEAMTRMAKRLSPFMTLRSGGAHGADASFEIGAGYNKEIFIPWDGFNGLHPGNGVILANFSKGIGAKALEMAEHYHPAWNACSKYARFLHARNCFQVLGKDLESPVEFVACWTPGGAECADDCTRETGGTGMAIRIASDHDIPVYNMKNNESLHAIADLLKGIEQK